MYFVVYNIIIITYSFIYIFVQYILYCYYHFLLLFMFVIPCSHIFSCFVYVMHKYANAQFLHAKTGFWSTFWVFIDEPYFTF